MSQIPMTRSEEMLAFHDGHFGGTAFVGLAGGDILFSEGRRFSVSSDEKAESADKQFAEILREGPALGMHILTWSDMLNTAERTFDRQSLREFDHRVLLQMSAGDSSNLIDSPAANQLGFHRALYYSEENGVLEKFRPYALMSESLLKNITARFGAKSKERRAKSKE